MADMADMRAQCTGSRPRWTARALARITKRVDRESLKLELKRLLVEALKLEDVRPEDIEDEAPLFGAGLGLDSIDALELAVAVERRYKVPIPDQEAGKRAFGSINMLVDYVSARRA
jgi:acyl carrier protein